MSCPSQTLQLEPPICGQPIAKSNCTVATGVGKTAILFVEGLAQRIVSGDVPSILEETRLVSLEYWLLAPSTEVNLKRGSSLS